LSGKQFRATKVLINPTADVDDFLEVVKAKHSYRLSTVDVDKPFVYKNKQAFDTKEEPLEEGSLHCWSWRK
jgi:hypothetical protein